MTNSVGTAADTCDDNVWQAPWAVGEGWVPHLASSLVETLCSSLIADDRLEIPDNVWKGVRANCAPNNIMRGTKPRPKKRVKMYGHKKTS